MNTQKEIIPTNSQFTEEFITNHADVIDWYYITQNIERCINFSDDFFLRFNSMILWKQIIPLQKLTTQFVHKHQDKLSFIAWYNQHNQLHRDNDEPAVIYPDGAKHWYQNGEMRRNNDSPAIISSDGSQYWHKNGLLHRDNDEPAVIYADGTKEWWINGQPHRDNDMPAIIYPDGRKEWYQNGLFHRDNDEPSFISADETKYWYKNGTYIKYNKKQLIHSFICSIKKT